MIVSGGLLALWLLASPGTIQVPDLPPEDLLRLARAYQERGVFGPVIPYLTAAAERCSTPQERESVYVQGVSLLQAAGERDAALEFIGGALEGELRDRGRAALLLRRAKLLGAEADPDQCERDFLYAWNHGGADVKPEAGFRLVLRWKESESMEDRIRELEASSSDDDLLLLAHATWWIRQDRQEAVRLYLEWLDRGHWEVGVVDRAEAQYRAADKVPQLEDLLRRRWEKAANRNERDRAARGLLESLQNRGVLDGLAEEWTGALERDPDGAGTVQDMQLHMLAVHLDNTDPDVAVVAWLALLARRPGMPEALDKVVPAMLAAGDGKGLVRVLEVPEQDGVLSRGERVKLLLWALERAIKDRGARVQFLAPILDTQPVPVVVLEVLHHLYVETGDPRSGETGARLVELGIQEAAYLRDAVQVDLRGNDRDGLERHLALLVERSREDASRAAMELARLALARGDKGQVERWIRRVVECADYETWLPAVYSRAAAVLVDAGLMERAAGLLRAAVGYCRSLDEIAMVMEAQVRYCLAADRPVEAARIAWSSLSIRGLERQAWETRRVLLHQARERILSGDMGQDGQEGEVFPETLGMDPSRALIRFFYAPDTPGKEQCFGLLDRIEERFGDQVQVQRLDIAGYEAFRLMLDYEKDFLLVPVTRAVFLVAGPTVLPGHRAAAHLESILAGDVPLHDLGYVGKVASPEGDAFTGGGERPGSGRLAVYPSDPDTAPDASVAVVVLTGPSWSHDLTVAGALLVAALLAGILLRALRSHRCRRPVPRT